MYLTNLIHEIPRTDTSAMAGSVHRCEFGLSSPNDQGELAKSHRL